MSAECSHDEGPYDALITQPGLSMQLPPPTHTPPRTPTSPASTSSAMTSSAHDDRIEVLSVTDVAVPPGITRAGRRSGSGGGRSGSGGGGRKGSRKDRTSRAAGLSLGTISGAVDGASVCLVEDGAMAPSPDDECHPGLPRRHSDRDRDRDRYRERRVSDRSERSERSGSRRSSSGGTRRHHNHNSSMTSHHSHHQGRGDSRRGRGYTHLVPSPDDPTVKVVAPGTGGALREPPLSSYPGHPLKEPKTESQKRVARVVMVLATLMLGLSLLLVGVTLSMSDHIDEMVRKMNGLSTTQRPRPRPTAAARRNITTTPQPYL